MEKLDRRVKRTHQLLGDALIDLILEKGYEAVTIRDITERADVAYVTFFRHYKDKAELLSKRLKEIFEELDEITHENNRATEGLLIFQHVEQNVPLYRIVFASAGAYDVRNNIRKYLTKHLLQCCEPFKNPNQPTPPDVAANHFAAGLMSLIEWWLENNMPYPPERMAQIYEHLILAPVHQLERDTA
jgi:AcrR family transcriptional regulator